MTVSAKRETKVELKSTFDPKGVQDAKRALRQEEREQARAAKQAERDARRMRKEVLGAGRGILGGVAHGMEVALGFQALGGIEGAARGVFAFNEQLMRFQLAARKTPAEAQKIGAAAREVAVETGLSAEAVLAGERAYVDRAGAEKASIASMRMLARTAQASGAAIGDMATVVYSLGDALHIKPEEMEDVIGGLINQSKDGTIHFQNMAEEIIALGPKFARFGVYGREGAAQLGAMLQIAGTGFKDAAEASTGIQGLFRGLQLHEDKFRAAGVATMSLGKDGAKHLRPLKEIVLDISKSSLMKDPSKLLKDIGRGEGDAFIRLWIEKITQFNDLVEAAMANGVVQKDLAVVTESASVRIAIAMEKAKNAFADMLTPEMVDQIVNGIEGIGRALPPILKMVGSVADRFMDVVNTVARYKNENADVDDANPFKKDADAAAKRLKGYYPPTDAGAAARQSDEELLGTSAEWHTTAARLRRLAPGAPNEAAVRAAIAASKEVYANGAPIEGAQTAGKTYLENVPPGLVDKVRKELAHEQGAALVQQYVKPIAEQIGNSVVAAFKDAMTYKPTGAEQAAARYRELYGKDPPVTVKIGSEPVVQAVKNSSTLNRAPGGRR